MATFKPAVYRTSGGDEQVVASSGRLEIGSGGEIDIESGGRLEIAGTPFISSGGGVALGSLTSGDVTFPGKVTATSGVTGTSGTFTNVVAVTSGITALKATLSSALSVGEHGTFTTGLSATTGNFSGGIALTSGISGTTGQFSGAVGIGGHLTLTTGLSVAGSVIWSSIAAASSGSTGFGSYGITQIWSCGESTGTAFTMPAAAAAGTQKYLACIASTSTAPAVVTIAGTLINGVAGITFSTGSAGAPQWIHLIAQNTTNWMIIGMSTDVTVA